VRGPQLSSTFVSKLQTWIFILGFHPHPDLLPSREKELNNDLAWIMNKKLNQSENQ